MWTTTDDGMVDTGTEQLPSPTFLIDVGGRLEMMLRAETIEDWYREAQRARILVEVTLDDGSTALVDAPGVDTDGPFYPPTARDENRNVTATDARPHFNVRVSEPALSASDDGVTPNWELIAGYWMNGAPIPPADQNQGEEGVVRDGITLLDPRSISTPARVFM